MHGHLLDVCSRHDSVIRRLPAGLKLAMALAGLIVAALLPLQAWGFFLGYALALFVVAALSRLPAVFLLKRLLLLEPFVLGMALLAWFQPNGGRVFLGVVIKSTLCLGTTILLANTTPFGDMLRVMRRVRVPALLVTTLALMFRYLYVLVDEAARMQRARAARTFTARRAHLWHALASVIGLLFVRATERAERIHAAMCARGWK